MARIQVIFSPTTEPPTEESVSARLSSINVVPRKQSKKHLKFSMTTYTDISGTTEISDEGIKKHFKSIESWQPLFELVWNGFDAKSNVVAVKITDNDLHGTTGVSVLDDGDGIDPTTLKDTFGKFNDSLKREDAAQHGAHGRGRLAFHRLCRIATWHTKSSAGEAQIVIDAASIKSYRANVIPAQAQCSELRDRVKGTLVELEKFSSNLPILSELREKFSIEFGWFLALNPSKVLSVNEAVVKVPSHEITEKRFNLASQDFDVQVIRWNERPSSEKSYTYLLDGAGKTVYKQLSTLNNKTSFFTSIYISSPWANTFASEQDLLNPNAHTPNSQEWKKLIRQIGDLTESIYEKFLREQAVVEIDKYEEDGLFPPYTELSTDERNWRLENAKELVKTIYVADPTVFSAASKKQRKMIIRLLDRLAVSNENESLFEVLNSVLDLDDKSVKTLANQLKQTTLENIVSTIEILQRRQIAASRLRTLMDEHYLEVLETPDLQKIIENNTWLFGAGYETLGAEEDTFTKIAKYLREKIPQVNNIDADDLDGDKDVVGAKRQTDLFLARKIPTVDSNGQKFYRCVIIEIKRPSISLNIRHLRQLDDYASIVKKHPAFGSEKLRFELILIGRKISSSDTEIASRMNGQIARGELGLVSDDPGMKRYVINWYTLLDSFELTNSFLLDQLKLKRSLFEASTKQELVSQLQG